MTNEPTGTPGGRPTPALGRARRAGWRALAYLTLSLVAAGACMLLLTRYLARHRTIAAPPLTRVVVAAADLPAATLVRAEHLRAIEWPKGEVPEGAALTPQAIVGRVVLERFVKGEPVLEDKLVPREGGRGLAAVIPPAHRAVAVRVDDVVGVAGFLVAGDRVDVVATIRPEEGEDVETTSKVVLQNVRVLAVGHDLAQRDDDSGKARQVTVATLLVTPPESERLALAAATGKLVMALRGHLDEDEVATPGIDATSLLGVESPRRPVVVARVERLERPARATKERKASPPAKAGSVVEILRGDRIESRKFEEREEQ